MWQKIKRERITQLLKLLFLVILIFISLSFYLFLTQKRIVSKEVITDFTQSPIENKPERMESYIIKYRNNEDYLIHKYIFSDSKKAEGFFEEFLNKLNEQNREQELRGEEKSFIDQTQIEFNGYSGFKGKILKPEKRFGIIIRKDNFVIISSSKDEKNLNKVIKWFIKRNF